MATKEGKQAQDAPAEATKKAETKKAERQYITLTAPEGTRNVAAIAVRGVNAALEGKDVGAIRESIESAVQKALVEAGFAEDLIVRDDLKLAVRFELYTAETKPAAKETTPKAKKFNMTALMERAKTLNAEGMGKREAMAKACEESGITVDTLKELMGFLG